MANDTCTGAARGIYLVGFSGSGKSTVARILADRLGWESCDLDDLIADRAGMSIAEIFQNEGEAGFRQRETEALRTVSLRPPFVIATGGGTIVREENRAIMSRSGWSILLEADPEVIHARLSRHLKTSDQKAIRPLLETSDRLAKIRALKDARQSSYDLADITIHTDDLTPDEVATEVLRAVALLPNSL